MANNFAAQVNAWVAATKERTEAVFKQASMEVVREMLERTPRDTGFLAASLTVNLSGPVPMNRANPGNASGGVQPYVMTIAGANLGDTIFATFGANYAGFVEYGTSKMAPRAMVRMAAQQWPAIVSRVSARAQSGAGR